MSGSFTTLFMQMYKGNKIRYVRNESPLLQCGAKVMAMPINLKRAYEKPGPEDGYRVLVDRIWPRGISKDELKIDEWMKEAAPSDRLRKSFHNGELTWSEFRNGYLSELKSHRDELRRVVKKSKEGTVSLIFGARDEKHNNAVVMKQYLKMLGAG